MLRFSKTRMLREASLGAEPHHPAVEVLIFLLLAAVASLLQGLILLPADLMITRFTLSDALLTLAALFSTVVTAVICILYCRKLERRSYVSLGLCRTGAVGEYLIGLLIGLVLLTAAVLACVMTGAVTVSAVERPQMGIIAAFLLGYMLQGLSEELLCRSYLMMSLSRNCSIGWCILTNSLLFAALHLGNSGVTPLSLVNLTLFGVLASVYTLRRGSIWGIAAIHTMWNFAQGNLFGISVSGMNPTPSILTTAASDDSSALIHGGSFGLEGGMAVTAVLAVALAVMLGMRSKRSELVEEVAEKP